MLNKTTAYSQKDSSVYVLPLSVKKDSQKESISQVFTNQIVSPSHLKCSEGSTLSARTIQEKIKLPPPKTKDPQPNWFEIAINPRPDQSTSSPDVAISPCSDPSPLSFNDNEALQQEIEEWLQELMKHQGNHNQSTYEGIDFKDAVTVHIEVRDPIFDLEDKDFLISSNQDDSIKTPPKNSLFQFLRIES